MPLSRLRRIGLVGGSSILTGKRATGFAANESLIPQLRSTGLPVGGEWASPRGSLCPPIPATLAIGGMGAQRQPAHCPFGLVGQAEQVGPSGRYAFPFHSVQASSVCRFICSNKSWCLTYSCRKPVRTITRIIATSNNIAAKMK